MDFAELQAKSDRELNDLLGKCAAELAAARFSVRTKQIKQVHTFSDRRRTIARIKMILHQRPPQA